MATKTTTKTTATTKETEVQTQAPTTVQEAPKTRRKFGMNDLIECRSVTYGELLLPAKKSQLLYTWSNYGDTTEVEFQDLQALKSMNSAYLKAPMFVILDEELLEQWPDLKPLYENVMVDDFKSLFDLPLNQFKAKLKKFPASYRETIKNVASAMINDGVLDSVSKIKAIDECLGTELSLYLA